MRWGRIPAISQYVLIFIAVTFTWLMGLMGYVRSGLRQHWHVYGVIRDTSADAFTPTLGFATQVVSVTVLAFFLLIGFVFWITSLHDRPEYVPAPAPERVPHTGGHMVLGGAVAISRVPSAKCVAYPRRTSRGGPGCHDDSGRRPHRPSRPRDRPRSMATSARWCLRARCCLLRRS